MVLRLAPLAEEVEGGGSAIKTRGAPLHGCQRAALYWWRDSQNRTASKGRPFGAHGAALPLF